MEYFYKPYKEKYYGIFLRGNKIITLVVLIFSFIFLFTYSPRRYCKFAKSTKTHEYLCVSVQPSDNVFIVSIYLWKI